MAGPCHSGLGKRLCRRRGDRRLLCRLAIGGAADVAGRPARGRHGGSPRRCRRRKSAARSRAHDGRAPRGSARSTSSPSASRRKCRRPISSSRWASPARFRPISSSPSASRRKCHPRLPRTPAGVAPAGPAGRDNASLRNPDLGDGGGRAGGLARERPCRRSEATASASRRRPAASSPLDGPRRSSRSARCCRWAWRHTTAATSSMCQAFRLNPGRPRTVSRSTGRTSSRSRRPMTRAGATRAAAIPIEESPGGHLGRGGGTRLQFDRNENRTVSMPSNNPGVPS